jgi:putative ABC transport system permease protein
MVVGSIIYRVVIAVVLFLGLKATDMKLISAIIVAIALFLPVAKRGIQRMGGHHKATRQPALVPDQAIEDSIDNSDKDPDEPNQKE